MSLYYLPTIEGRIFLKYMSHGMMNVWIISRDLDHNEEEEGNAIGLLLCEMG